MVIIRQTKPIFKLEWEFDESNPYMKFERNLIKMTKWEWPQQQTLIGGGYFVGHLGYQMSKTTHIRTWKKAIHIWSLEEIWLKMTELEWPRQRILIGGGHFVDHLGYWTKPVFKLDWEVDGSNPYMKFGRNLIKNDWVRVTMTADIERWRHFVGHLGYRMLDKTCIRTWTRGWWKQSIYEIRKKSD